MIAAAPALASALPAHGGPGVPPPLDLRQLVTAWGFEPVPIVALLLVGGLYFMGITTLRERGDEWPAGRALGFFAGLAVAAYAILGGIGRYDQVLFSAHMAQHMLLAMVVPVLLALGAPITLALRTLPARPRGWLLAVLQSKLGAVLVSPALGFALMAATPFALYFSGLYQFTLEHSWAHYLIHAHFVAVGCLFFWPLLGIDPLPHRPPHWARVLVLFLMLPFHAFLGIALMTGDTAIAASYYASVGRTWGASVLSDQHTGGGLMWAAGDILGGFLFLTVLIQWSRADEREARRTDRKLDRAEAIALREVGLEPEQKVSRAQRQADEDAALEAYNARLAQLADEK